MHTAPIVPETLASSVIAVPPLARNADLSLNTQDNVALIRHLEGGGVSTLLYGGNAVLYHVAMSEYADLLQLLVDSVAPSTLAIPSVGPSYGLMMDQASVIREFNFPTSMVLPTRDVTTPTGVSNAVQAYVQRAGHPAVLYVKHDGYVDVDTAAKLMHDGFLSWIKYAVVRDDDALDPWLRALVDAVGPERIVSGIGEQPAVTHMNQFGLVSFTSGCVCVAPQLSMNLLRYVRGGDWDAARQLQATFRPLEDLRNDIHPVRVLHAAVGLAGLADMGPVLPLLSEVDSSQEVEIRNAAVSLLEAEKAARAQEALPT
mgnify:CR=1 FL=1